MVSLSVSLVFLSVPVDILHLFDDFESLCGGFLSLSGPFISILWTCCVSVVVLVFLNLFVVILCLLLVNFYVSF